jgi:hypothetical protein
MGKNKPFVFLMQSLQADALAPCDLPNALHRFICVYLRTFLIPKILSIKAIAQVYLTSTRNDISPDRYQ